MKNNHNHEEKVAGTIKKKVLLQFTDMTFQFAQTLMIMLVVNLYFLYLGQDVNMLLNVSLYLFVVFLFGPMLAMFFIRVETILIAKKNLHVEKGEVMLSLYGVVAKVSWHSKENNTRKAER